MLEKSRNNNSEPMRWAKGSDGRFAFIDDVPNGLSCNCTCIKCNQPVMAKNNEANIKEHHFAHYGDYTNENIHRCDGVCDEEMIHKMAEQIICQYKCIMLPNYLHYQAKRVNFVNVEVEERNDRSDMQPDIVGITAEGDRILIEIKNTHPVGYEKLQKIYKDKLICLEIDISKQDQDSIEKFLLQESDSRVWLNNPKYLDKAIEELKTQYPNSEEHKASFCTQVCTRYYDCRSKKYSIHKARREGQTIVLCNYADSEDKRPLTKKSIKNPEPKENVFKDYAQIEIPSYQQPAQLDLFGDPIVEVNQKAYPFEPPKGVPNPLKLYYNKILNKKDNVFHNANDDAYLIINVYLHENNLNVETYGQRKYKQPNTKPFRVYVIKYDYASHRYVYKPKDFYPDDEFGADKYAQDHNE